MRIKSFYASTVEGAVALARRDMGAEAMLVESRKAPLEARHLGEYEVVCALVPEADGAQPQSTRVNPPADEDAGTYDARLSRELAEMRRQLEVMGKTITRSAWSGARWPSANPEMSEWHARLTAADMEGELVHQILGAAERRGGPESNGLEGAVLAEIEQRILVDSALGAANGPRVVALAGPPGAGKTTMLAKLAVTCGLAARRSLALVSMDDFRVAGADQLRSYAAILGAGFQALDSVGALAHALDEYRGKRLVLIDTPGYGPRDMDRASDLARFLSTRPDIATHLVLTASMKSADLTHVVERFEIFRPSSLLFTRLDETACFGTAFSASVRHAKPISFLSTGQEIPDDLAPATKERIMSLLWPQTLVASRLAA
jgi:flagellar biosynthesis protein FlhF